MRGEGGARLVAEVRRLGRGGVRAREDSLRGGEQLAQVRGVVRALVRDAARGHGEREQIAEVLDVGRVSEPRLHQFGGGDEPLERREVIGGDRRVGRRDLIVDFGVGRRGRQRRRQGGPRKDEGEQGARQHGSVVSPSGPIVLRLGLREG
ncbi:hypothetical protein [Nannocystis pusilla]|uniref:hypothetical protein n=1 Tax=Nannocystis pusilla TaxID=889268 RepID=UPI003B816A51